MLWNGGPAFAAASPTVANGVVYTGSAFRQIYALSAATGTVLWSYATGGAVISSPVVANGDVYTGSNDGNIYAFDLSAGQGAPARAEPRRPAPQLPPPTAAVGAAQPEHVGDHLTATPLVTTFRLPAA